MAGEPFDNTEVEEIQAALEAFALEQSEREAAEIAAEKARMRLII